MNNRPTSDAFRVAMKLATRRAIEQAGGLKTVAAHTRVSASNLSDYCNDRLSTFVPLDVAADIDALCGANIILGAWQDYSLAAKQQNTEAITGHLSSVMTDTGHLMKVVGEGLGDGVLTRREASDSLRAASEVKEEIIELEQHLAEIIAAR